MDRFFALDPILLAVLTVIIVLLAVVLILLIYSRIEIRAIKYKYSTLMEYLGNGDSKDLLQECVNMIRELEFNGKIYEKDISDLYEMLSSCVQKVAIIRYNAFNDVGSNLSYSIALMDNDDNGIVLSGLYGREVSTTYAKPIESGQSFYILTGEEEEAIAVARKKHIGKSYYGIRKKIEQENV
jgi:hypothetical protein